MRLNSRMGRYANTVNAQPYCNCQRHRVFRRKRENRGTALELVGLLIFPHGASTSLRYK
jgi:hypothetical protein